MALFLSKVFGRRKHEDKASTSSKSSASPLEGKFEYVIPSPSPEKGPDYPHLSLSFPEHQETRVLSSIFENGDVAGKKRLSPEQALTIIRACSQVIVARGLETLGIMHPHWHSASPATQQRLILLFIQSSAAEFESEVNSTRSAHDVAAVFRWAIRHLELSGPFFGQKEAWYHDFFEAEKSASYPPKSFAQILAPQLPATNLELLTTAVDLFSSLAAHSEANGISGSKLSKSLGLWLLTSERSTPGDDFLTFYAKWDKYGRMMEHLFLSHIRNEIANHRMPKRLVELVKHYPYTGKDQSSTEEYLLPRPRFSTRRYDALFVHIDTENSSPRAAKVSLQMVADALNAITPSSDTPPYSIWRKVQQNASAGDEELLYSPSTDKFPGVGRILSDETLGILSLLAEDVIQRESSITFIPRADSPQETGSRNTTSYSRLLSASSSDTVTVQRPNLDTLGLNVDWNSFSSSGFSQSSPLLTPLAETLLESKDSEVTSPSRKGSKKSVKTPGHRSRRSLDVLPPITIPSNSRVTRIDIIPLDESFIDFWNDSLLDPITDVETWPKFVVCKLKTSVTSELVFGEGTAGKKVEWIVVEQHYVKPTPNISSNPQLSPTNPSAETSEGPSVERASSPQSPFKRASSPRPSLSSVNASMKRFSFWGGSKKDKGVTEDVTTSTKKKKGKGVKVGEMGEILAEENKSPVAASPHKKALEVPVAVQEEQESRDVAKNEQAAEAKAEVGEAIPVSEIAAVTVMEKVQDDPVSPESAKSVENVVRSSEELVEDDTLEPPETSASHKEEIAPVDEPTAPEARLPATLSNPEPVSQEDAPQPASQEDAPTVSDIQSQPDHVEEVSLNLEPTSKDVPETTSTTEQTTEQSNEDVPMNLPEEAELPSITEELISGPTGQQLPETSTNEHLVNSTSATSSPAEIPEVPIVLEPVVILPENDVPEAGDDSFDEIAAASSLESPEIVPAPDQEVPGPTEDVEIEHKEAEITKDLETEVALEQLASTPSVDLVPESAEGILPEDEEDPPAPSLETAENAEEVADEIEPHVRSELIREPAPGLEDDHVSLSEVPIVDAPVIPPASPSVPSLDTSTPEEEQGMESQTPVGDSPSELSQNQLPPAPETVVLSGGTVGPALALSSSEVTASAPADEPGHAEDESQTVEDDSKASDEDGAVNIEGSEGVETDPQTSEPHKVESHNEAERK
ncbi:hypothetical protein F5878DRAFT_535662 [Lentinula raphanica]|uniref:Rho-GAP domain-containing protein n=1 Tax=Lentinula raphanica TaxID=153919 RepID=A0AA38UF30_9AGAR|nr:hypothetical protein F5878DRAFT_535662 [Lentinula raphanica]